MADVRKIIEADRGWIKKIQTFLPGYKKYRTCEDLRVADNLVRLELAGKLEIVEEHVKRSREEISKGLEFDLINRIGELVNIAHGMTEKVKHAEQGYAPWISGDVRIEEDELNKLYDYDLSLMENAEALIKEAKVLEDACLSGSSGRLENLASLRRSVEDFEKIFDSRMATVTNVAQKP